MTSQKPLHFKTFLLILVMVIAGPLGNVMLGKGMKQAGRLPVWPPSQAVHTALRVFGTGSIWLGVAALLTFFLANLLVLTWADYSFVLPASSMGYGVVALLGYLRWASRFHPCAGWVSPSSAWASLWSGRPIRGVWSTISLTRGNPFFAHRCGRNRRGTLRFARHEDVGEVKDFRPLAIVRVVLRALRSGWMWAGVGMMALAFFSLLGALSFLNVSFVVPVTALSYVAGAGGAALFLGERVSPQRWMGVLLVAVGVTLVFLGNR